MLNKKTIKWLIILILITLTNCIHYVKKARKEHIARVAVVCGVDRVNIGGIKDKVFYKKVAITTNHKFPIYFSQYKGYVYVNGKKYRGNLKIQKIDGRIWVINVLNIEDYLKGVVPCEIGRISKNIIEAAKAQAVAARTYAYAHLNQHKDLGFDLYATIQDQVYKDVNCESELTNRAVEETERQILTYNGKAIEAKYHSTCGGKTAYFNDAWPGDPPPYLRSVNCPYCKNSPHYKWKKAFSKGEFFKNLRFRLKRVGYEIPQGELIKNLRLIKNKKSKRIIRIIIKTEKEEYVIPGYHTRSIFGDHKDPGGLLKSNLITINVKGNHVIIEGMGFGHGVGMCQFGAIEMARKGKSYKQILYHYYRGTKIKKIE